MSHLLRLSLPLLAATLLPVTAAAVEAAHDHSHGAAAGTNASPGATGATAPGTTATTPSAPATSATTAPAGNDRIDRQLQRMRELHERMAAAKSPAERQRLQADNRRLLQEAMELLRAQPAAHDMAMMHHGDAGTSPGAAPQAMPGDPAAGPGAAMGGAGPAEGRKRMGAMPMQQCHDMHAAQARHMELMHAVLQALVDQQAAAPSR